MKNAYRVVLIGLAVLGVVYASTGPEKMKKDVKYDPIEKCLKSSTGPEKMTKDVKYDPVEICMFPVFMEVGHYVQFKDCNKSKIELKQVKCSEIGQANDKFPCYKGCVTIKVRANFPAILSASLNKSGGDVDILKEMNLHWENGVNTIQGDKGDWEELKLYLEAWDVEIWKSTVGTVKVGEITIKVKPKDTQLED
jgi:hypothetical protein